MPQESSNPNSTDQVQAPRRPSMQFIGGSIDPTTGNLIAGNRMDAEQGRPGIPGSDEAKAAQDAAASGSVSSNPLAPPAPQQSQTRLGRTSVSTSGTRPLIDRGAMGTMLGPMAGATGGYAPGYAGDERGAILNNPVNRSPGPDATGGGGIPGYTNPATAPIQPGTPTAAPVAPTIVPVAPTGPVATAPVVPTPTPTASPAAAGGITSGNAPGTPGYEAELALARQQVAAGGGPVSNYRVEQPGLFSRAIGAIEGWF